MRIGHTVIRSSLLCGAAGGRWLEAATQSDAVRVVVRTESVRGGQKIFFKYGSLSRQFNMEKPRSEGMNPIIQL